MHLTQLSLDPQSALARRDLADPYELHRTLVRAFVTDDQQTPPRFLWRLEAQANWNEPVLLVQSRHPADWTYLDSLPGYLRKPALSKAVNLETLLVTAGRYRFRLLANPTVTRAGKRHGLVGEEAQLAWLTRQGERLGFSVETALTTGSDVLHSRKGTTRISLQRVCYEGVLQARDSVALSDALQDGIGPGKAFGCGLLSLARL